MQLLIEQWLQLFFSRKAVANRLQYMCDRGFNQYEQCILLQSITDDPRINMLLQ